MPLAPGRPKLPVTRKSSFSRYELSVQCRLCWMPRSTRTTFAAREDHATARSTSASGTPGVRDTGLDRQARSAVAQPSSKPVVCGARGSRPLAAAPDDDREHRGHQERVGPGRSLQVQVGDFARPRSPRVDHDHLPRRASS